MSFMAGQSYLMSAIAAWNTELLPPRLPGHGGGIGRGCLPRASSPRRRPTRMLCSLYGLMTLAAGCVALITVLAYGAVAGAFAGDAAPMTIAAAAFGSCAYRVRLPCPEEAGQRRGAWSCRAGLPPLSVWIASSCAMWVIGSDCNDFFGLILQKPARLLGREPGDGRCRSTVPIPSLDSASASAD